jgi:hypothetical protein
MTKEFVSPAFPIPGLQGDEDFNGLSKREYIAIKVLSAHAMYAENGYSLRNSEHRQQLAWDCYAMADAMIAEGAK